MTVEVDKDLADVLAAASIGLTKGMNLFRGPPRAAGGGIPHQAVFVLAWGGPSPIPLHDGSKRDLIMSRVQITVRGAPEKFDDGQTLARAVKKALHEKPPSGYIDVTVQESEPLYLKQDEYGHHEWVINIEAKHAE